VQLGEGGDLRQVGDAQHLMVRRELGEATPDAVGRAAADPRIDLVEDEHHARTRRTRGPGERQEQTRELAARGHLCAARAAAPRHSR
jgi:hypothetical protein